MNDTVESYWNGRLEYWKKEIRQMKKILIHVVLNQLLTLAGWYFVYDCKTDINSFGYYLLDSRRNFTTGNDIYDGILNGFFCVTLIGILSFLMLITALYNFRRLIRCWLSISCLLIIFGISTMFTKDALNAAGVHSFSLTSGISVFYGFGGVITFFNPKTPLFFHQIYVICNCALVSLYYLRLLPGHTSWFLLGTVVIWDLFAVLTPLGPLNLATGCAGNYSDSVLRFLMFTAEVPEEYPKKQKSTLLNYESCEIAEDSSGNFKSNSEIENQKHFGNSESMVVGKTAKDALDDDSLGDFVFYSVLVGKAASSGSVLATIAAVTGVLVGLIITLSGFPGSDAVPALPCPVVFGTVFYFVAHLIEPGFHQVILYIHEILIGFISLI